LRNTCETNTDQWLTSQLTTEQLGLIQKRLNLVDADSKNTIDLETC
jgi:hypothetical protein